MADAPEPTIGSTVHIVASVPATESVSAYETLTGFEKIYGVLSVPEFGDDSETGTLTLLETGRTQHYNSVNIVPPFTIPYKYKAADAGQAIVRDAANSATEVTIRITDTDGRDVYIQGVLGNLRDTERTPQGFRGESIEFRSITGRTISPAA